MMQSFFSFLRRKVFWLSDLIKGRPVYSNYVDVRRNIRGYSNLITIKARNKYLKELLEHATANVSFYRHLNADISCFPVINKNIIRSSPKLFLADGYTINKLYSVTTSGSTGTPFTIYQDKRKRYRHIADNIFLMS
jgi:phenylacetate-CoA ligase